MFFRKDKFSFIKIYINKSNNSNIYKYLWFFISMISIIISLFSLYSANEANIQSLQAYKTSIRPAVIAIWYNDEKYAINIRNFSESLALNFWWFLKFRSNSNELITREIIIWETLTLAPWSNEDLSNALIFLYWYDNFHNPPEIFCIDYTDLDWNKYFTAWYKWLSFTNWIWDCIDDMDFLWL